MTKTMLTTVACVIGFFAIQAQGPALAAETAKTPVTGTVTKITQTSAVVSGTFFGGDFASIGWGYAPNQGMANCGPLKTTGTQSCVAQPLTCNTTYYFAATNGQKTGAWKPFKTLPCK